MDGSRSEIAFANCNSLEACQNALSEDFIPKTSVLWGKIKQYTTLLAKNDYFLYRNITETPRSFWCMTN